MKTLKPLFSSALVLATLVLAPVSSHAASLLGDSVDFTWFYPDLVSVFATDTQVIGAGVEISCPGGPGTSTLCAGFASAPASIDVDASSITYSQFGSPGFNAAPFNGFLFSDLDFSPASVLTGFVLTTNIIGLTPANVTFGADYIQINLQGLGAGDEVFFNLALETGVVPEPGTLVLLGAGLLGVAAVRRKRA
jgi:PEP-CTERM motif